MSTTDPGTPQKRPHPPTRAELETQARAAKAQFDAIEEKVQARTGRNLFADPAPWLVWNGSRSAPVGLYRVASIAPLRVGDLVLVRTPEHVRELAAVRGYLPATVPLVKRVAASDGDAVCAHGADIFVNGRRVAARLPRDRLGRSLPWWSGCRALDGEVFLLMGDVAASFDGRYFGPVPRDAVIGRLVPLWTE